MATIELETRIVPTPPMIAASSHALPAPSRIVVWLSGLVAVIAGFATIVGIVSQGGPGEFAFKTVRAESVQMFGHGIYRYDTLFQGPINRGNDVVTLALGIPLLIACIILYWCGSLRGRLLLTGILASFAYSYANMALGAAYNSLYLVYVALFSASLFDFVLTLRSIDLQVLASRFSPELPRRGPAIFLFAAGTITALLWLSDIVPTLLQGDAPKHLDSYTTSVTYSLDLAIITPACFVTGFLLLGRAPLGYAMAFALFGVIVILVPSIIAATISQLAAGVTLSTGEVVGPVAGFVILGLIAIWLLVALLRNIADVQPATTHR